MNILLLTVAAGGGHTKACEAIKTAILEKYPESNILIMDTLKRINPVLDKIIIGSYLNTIKTTPQLYGMLYEMSESTNDIRDFTKNLNVILAHRIKTLILQHKPDVIVCTHPFPLQMLSSLKKRKRVTVPTIGVLTDFVSHPFWMHECIEAYVVSHQFMKNELVRKNIPEGNIYPFGIPVSSEFMQKKEKAKLQMEFGLEDKLTLLVMGGSLGFGEVGHIFESLIRSEKDLQIIAITGNNSSLKKQLEKTAENSHKKIHIVGYTNRVSDYMDVSDFVISKPGGMTIAESLIKELPLFIISPIPGQEERNTEFLLNNGMAARLVIRDEIDNILSQILDNPLRINHMKEMARYYAKPNASHDIVGLIEKLITLQRDLH
jgi:processive 1,2-diacylglycerol beta-glucosyltransferase